MCVCVRVCGGDRIFRGSAKSKISGVSSTIIQHKFAQAT